MTKSDSSVRRYVPDVFHNQTSLSLLSIASKSQSKVPLPAAGSQTFSSRARPTAALSLDDSVLHKIFHLLMTTGYDDTSFHNGEISRRSTSCYCIT